MIQIALSAKAEPLSRCALPPRGAPRQLGISPISPAAPGGRITVRNGWYVSSLARAASTAAIASAQARGDSAATTSRWLRTSTRIS